MKTSHLTILLLACLVAAADAGMVTGRWGVGGRLQHPGTLKFEPLGDKGTLLVFDLSALPRGAAVYGARLFFSGVDWKERGFDIVPAVRAGGELRPAGGRLEPVGPFYQWLDATEAAGGWAKAGAPAGLLWLRNARAFRREATVLEISHEGELPGELPKQVRDVRAFHRAGQVFVTFREKDFDPLAQAEEPADWGDLAGRFNGDYYGPLPADGPDVRYRVYCHDEPITPANVGRARLLGEVLPGSAINTRLGLKVDHGRKTESLTPILAGRRGEGLATGAGVGVVRLAVEDGKPLPPHTGLFVHTVRQQGVRHFAVLTAIDGRTNARDISASNTAGPVRQQPGGVDPVLYKEIVTPLRGARHAERWYSLWTDQPLSPWPARYDVVVGYCPELLAKPAAVQIHRTGWNSWPTPPRAEATSDLHVSHTGDQPVEFRTGLHDSMGTIKGFDQGRWQPFHVRRQAVLLRWMSLTWPVDANRVNVGLGAWGMMEIKEGDRYATIGGWGEPELTKGFQCWDRARGIWGTPRMYAGRPDEENPYVAANLTDWVLAHPGRDLPFVYLRAGGGAHYTEEGWPPFPRFCWAMMQAKQPLLFCTARDSALADAIHKGTLVLRRDRSVPAFAHCSLDDNLGEGDLRSGNGWNQSQVNGWIVWDAESIVDEPDRWEITVWVGEGCPLPAGTVDLTPRRCRKFRPKAGQTFTWTNTAAPAKPGEAPPARAQEGAAADQHGLVTLKTLHITKAKHRISLRRARVES